MKYFYFIIALMLSSPLYAEVKATVDQSIVFEGDPIILTIVTNNNNNMKPELSPLEKDFTLLGLRASSQINIINGTRSFNKTWTIQLQATPLGKVIIPAITIGDETTESIEVTIKNLPAEVTAETNKHIFIEATVKTPGKDIYVQQQIPYVVKLSYDTTMQSGEFLIPEIDNANIRQLERDRKYQTIRAGKRFTVIEKRFVISPEKSGILHLPEIVVKGRIALSTKGSSKQQQHMNDTDMLNRFFNDIGGGNPLKISPFGRLFNRRSIGPTRPFSVRTKAKDVNILPVPKEFTGAAWLPAEDLIIYDSWKTSPPHLKVGEPVTRTITLQVKGLAGSQLPQIHIPKPLGIKVYPEKAETDTPNNGKTVYGVQRLDISYIPNKQGKVTIPETTIDWWDVVAGKQKTFTLPEWILNVSPGSSNNTVTNSPSEPMNDSAPEAIKDFDPNHGTSLPKKSWRIEILSISTVLLLFIAYFFYKNTTYFEKLKQRRSKPYLKHKNLTVLRKELLSACKTNNNKLVASRLLADVSLLWNSSEVHSLGILRSNLAEGSHVIKALDKSLYAEKSTKWDGEDLYKLIENGLIKKQKSPLLQKTGLPSLYPIKS